MSINAIYTDKEKRNQAMMGLLQEHNGCGSRYVYVHKKSDGEIFFVGNGCGDRATSGEHPPYWKHFTENILNNVFSIEIIKDNIDMDSAIEIKEGILNIYADQVINLQNSHRKFDMERFKVYHEAISNFNQHLNKGLEFEKTGDIELAIQSYENAYFYYINAMDLRDYEGGEIYLQAHTPIPPTKLVDRISLCLLNSNQFQKLIDFSKKYFLYFTRKEKTGVELNLLKRAEKAKKKLHSL